jgi:hypothetical protein
VGRCGSIDLRRLLTETLDVVGTQVVERLTTTSSRQQNVILACVSRAYFASFVRWGGELGDRRLARVDSSSGRSLSWNKVIGTSENAGDYVEEMEGESKTSSSCK